MQLRAKNLVTEVATTPPAEAAAHFRSRFAFEELVRLCREHADFEREACTRLLAEDAGGG